MTNFAKFLSINGLKRKDIASFLGVSGAFITQIASGERPLPDEKLAMIKQNTFGWDVSMLTQEKKASPSLISGLVPRPQTSSEEKIRGALNDFLKSEEDMFVNYLLSQIEDKDILIRELYKQIGMLEAKLDLARKGETASIVTGSSDADAV